MSTLAAIGTAAATAAEEARRPARDLFIEPEAIAVISRSRDSRLAASPGGGRAGSGFDGRA